MDAVLEPGGQVVLSLAIDHGQFAVLDRGAIIDVDAYSAYAQASGLAQFDGGIVVFTESNWTSGTPLHMHLAAQRPHVDLTAYDHVVGGGLACEPANSGSSHRRRPAGTSERSRSLRVSTA